MQSEHVCDINKQHAVPLPCMALHTKLCSDTVHLLDTWPRKWGTPCVSRQSLLVKGWV